MSLKILKHATSRNLIDLGTVKSRLGVTGTDQDALLLGMIQDASGTIEAVLGRTLARQRYLEKVPGLGDQELLLSGVPVESMGASGKVLSTAEFLTVTLKDAAITDFSVEGPEIGELHRDLGWTRSAPVVYNAYDPIVTPGTERVNVAAKYWAGYVLPGDGVRASDVDATYGGLPLRTLTAGTASAADTSITLSATSVGGTIREGFGLCFDESTAVYVVQADVVAVGNAFTGVTLFPALDVDITSGTTVELSPQYLPPAISAEAWRLVQAKNFELSVPMGVSSIKAEAFSATFETPKAVCDGMTSRLSAWRMM